VKPVAPLSDLRFRAEVYGGDAGVSVCLGGLDVQSPRRALRWLRRQAHRFADALDPDPSTAWAPPQTLRPVAHTERDAPAELRFWAGDAECQEHAVHRLTQGHPYEFLAHDDTCWYALTAHPLSTPAPARLFGAPAPAQLPPGRAWNAMCGRVGPSSDQHDDTEGTPMTLLIEPPTREPVAGVHSLELEIAGACQVTYAHCLSEAVTGT